MKFAVTQKPVSVKNGEEKNCRRAYQKAFLSDVRRCFQTCVTVFVAFSISSSGVSRVFADGSLILVLEFGSKFEMKI